MTRETRPSRRGGNAIEFALILPVLILLLFGIFEYAFFFNRYTVLSAAARDGARSAAMVTGDADPESVATEVITAYLERMDETEGLDVTAEVTGSAPTRTVVVTVSRPYTPIAGSYVPAPERITASFALRMEDQLSQADTGTP